MDSTDLNVALQIAAVCFGIWIAFVLLMGLIWYFKWGEVWFPVFPYR